MPTFIRPALIKAAQHINQLNSRTLATTAIAMAPKQEWMIIVPDHAGALEKRMEVRPYVKTTRRERVAGIIDVSWHAENISRTSSQRLPMAQ